MQRIKIPELLEDEWFKKGYKPTTFVEEEDVNVDDVAAAFNDSKVLCYDNISILFYLLCKDLLIILWKYKKDSIEAVFYV